MENKLNLEEPLYAPVFPPKSYRGLEWTVFAHKVLKHIEEYTVPQYGDSPQDQAEEFSPEDCVTQIKRYANRFGKQLRGPEEEMRDLLKIAHYACLVYAKLDRAGRA